MLTESSVEILSCLQNYVFLTVIWTLLAAWHFYDSFSWLLSHFTNEIASDTVQVSTKLVTLVEFHDIVLDFASKNLNNPFERRVARQEQKFICCSSSKEISYAGEPFFPPRSNDYTGESAI